MNNKILLVKKFWQFLNDAEFDNFSLVMQKNAKVILANTNESFKSCLDYIEFNKNYPGRWFASLENLVNTDNQVVTIYKVYSEQETHFVTSVFEFSDNLISKITEYWGEIGEPPEWRKID